MVFGKFRIDKLYQEVEAARGILDNFLLVEGKRGSEEGGLHITKQVRGGGGGSKTNNRSKSVFHHPLIAMHYEDCFFKKKNPNISS